MASFPAVTMTTEGLNMIAKASSGNIEDRLIITKVKFGDGVSEGNIREYTDVISPKMEVTLAEWEDRGDGRFRYTFTYNNKGVKTGFYHREIGLFAKSGDNGGEKLIAYSNAGSYPGYIDDETKEIPYQRLMINIGVGDTDNVTGQVDVSNAVTIEILDEHNADENAHAKLIKKLFGSSEATLESVKEKVNDWAKEVCLPLSGGELTGDITANNIYANNNILVFNNVEEMKASNKVKAGYTIKTLGFYEQNDGGGADYLVIDNIGEDEVNEASIIELQNGLYAKLLIKDYINIKWFGAKIDGETDDSTAFNKAVSYIESQKVYSDNTVDSTFRKLTSSYSLFIPKGNMLINNTITVNVGVMSLIADGTIIQAKNINGVAMHVWGDEKYASNPVHKVTGFHLIGQRNKDGEEHIGVLFDGETATTRSPSRVGLDYATITNFDKGLKYGKNYYIDNHSHLEIRGCNIGIYFPYLPIGNSGERPTYNFCSFYFNETDILLESSTNMFFSNCSFDYSRVIAHIARRGGNIYFTNCHNEWEHNANNDGDIKFKITSDTETETDAYGSFIFTNCNFHQTSTSSEITEKQPYCFDINTKKTDYGRTIFNNCYFLGMALLYKAMLKEDNARFYNTMYQNPVNEAIAPIRASNGSPLISFVPKNFILGSNTVNMNTERKCIELRKNGSTPYFYIVKKLGNHNFASLTVVFTATAQSTYTNIGWGIGQFDNSGNFKSISGTGGKNLTEIANQTAQDKSAYSYSSYIQPYITDTNNSREGFLDDVYLYIVLDVSGYENGQGLDLWRIAFDLY